MTRRYQDYIQQYFDSPDPFRVAIFDIIKLFLSQVPDPLSYLNLSHPRLGYSLMELAVIFNLVDHQDYLTRLYGATVRESQAIEICRIANERFCFDMVAQAALLEEPHLKSEDFENGGYYIFKNDDVLAADIVNNIVFRVDDFSFLETQSMLSIQFYTHAHVKLVSEATELLRIYLNAQLGMNALEISIEIIKQDEVNFFKIVFPSELTALLRSCFHRCILTKTCDVVPYVLDDEEAHVGYRFFQYEGLQSEDVIGGGNYCYLRLGE